MNPYAVGVVFSGVCGFVPNRPITDTDNPPTRMRVLLAEGTLRVKSQKVLPHYPFIKIPLDCLRRVEGISPALRFRARDGLWYVLFFMFSWDIDFDFGDSCPSGLQVVNGEPKNPEEPSEGEHDYFYWVANTEDFFPSAAFIDQGCLAEYMNAQRVAARASITSGSLRVKSLTRLGDKFVKWEFKPEGSDSASAPTKVLANEVVLEKRGLTRPVTIRGRKCGEKEENFEIDIAPREGDSEVNFEVGSMEWGRILDIPDREDDDDDLAYGGQFVARDLKVVYRLARVVDPSTPLPDYMPLPHAVPPGGTGRPIHCPFALFAAHPKA